MLFNDRLRQPTKSSVVLAETTVGQHLAHWTADAEGWKTPKPGPITELCYNGAVLDKFATRAAAFAAAQGWADVAGVLYLKLAAGETPFSGFVRAARTFYFSTVEKVLSDRYYDPRVSSLPSLSRRIERRFGGLPQIGGGVLKLKNLDSFFDKLRDLDWHSGETRLFLGIDLPGQPMSHADYRMLGRWLNAGLSGLDDAACDLELAEPKARLTAQLPAEIYTREAYPFIRDQEVGKPIPIAYGTVLSAAPACVHTQTKRFKLAGHAIHAIDAVKVWDDEAKTWTFPAFSDVSLGSAEFTLASWDGGAAIAVDFRGMELAGELMANPSDQIRDLCFKAGESVNEASFTAAKARLQLTRFDTWQYVAGAKREALAVISELLEAAQAYLTVNDDGELTLEVFHPEPGEGLHHFGDDDLLEEPRLSDDPATVVSVVDAVFAERQVEKWAELTQHSTLSTQHRANVPEPIRAERKVKLSRVLDAQYWVQRITREGRRPARTVHATTHLHGLLAPPAAQVRLSWQRWGFDELLEVLEQRLDLGNDRVTFVLGDRHGWESRAGLWVDEATTLPGRFAGLAGYGVGGLRWQAEWAPAIKRWALQNCGYWMSDRNFVLDDDPDSFDLSQWV